jgi:predicted nucleotidyltransferase
VIETIVKAKGVHEILSSRLNALKLSFKTMRLTTRQIDTIKRTAQAVLGDGAQVTLFGSRVDDSAKGGDVDLYIEIPQPDLMKKIRCKVSLQDQLDMPVDLIVKPYGDRSPIALIAKHEGIRL